LNNKYSAGYDGAHALCACHQSAVMSSRRMLTLKGFRQGDARRNEPTKSRPESWSLGREKIPICEPRTVDRFDAHAALRVPQGKPPLLAQRRLPRP